eukprot:1466303-Pleurochrysis_carterae.AAC.1
MREKRGRSDCIGVFSSSERQEQCSSFREPEAFRVERHQLDLMAMVATHQQIVCSYSFGISNTS